MFIDCGRQEVRLDDHSSHIIVKNSKQVRSQRLCVCFRDNRSFSVAETLVKVKGEEFGWCQLLGNKAPLFCSRATALFTTCLSRRELLPHSKHSSEPAARSWMERFIISQINFQFLSAMQQCSYAKPTQTSFLVSSNIFCANEPSKMKTP